MARTYAIALGIASTLLTITSGLPSVAQTAANGQVFQNRGEIIFQNPVNRSAGTNYQANPAATGQRPATVYNSAGYQHGERLRESSPHSQPYSQPSTNSSVNSSVYQNSSYRNSVYQNQAYQNSSGSGQAIYQTPAAARQSAYPNSADPNPVYQNQVYPNSAQSAYGRQSAPTAATLGNQSQSARSTNSRANSVRSTTGAAEKVGTEQTLTVPTVSTSAVSASGVTETETAYVRAPSLESPITPTYDASVIDYFLEIAMGAEFNNSAEVVRKWESDIRIRVNGNPTAADLQTLRSIVDEINGMNLTIRMQIVDQNPNVEMYFVPEQQFSRYEPNYRPVNMGYAWVRWSNYQISSASILISTTGVNQQERSHLIREELTQAMGLLQDSYRYPDSIFYQGWTDTTAYTALDRKVIQLLYSPTIQTGMSRDQVMATLGNGSNMAGRAVNPSVSPAPLRSRF